MRRFLALLVTAALLTGACASDDGPDPSENPKAALIEAIERLGGYEGLTAVITVDSDSESLVAVSEGELTDDQAELVLDSSLSITSKSSDDPKDAQAEFVADIGGDKVEIKAVDQTIYVRADVEELFETFGGNTAELDTIERGAPPGFEFVGPALDGEWIGITGAQEFAEQFGGFQQPSEEEAANFQKEFADKLTAAFEENSTVESVGSDDIGEHLEARVEIRGLFEAFLEVIQSAPGVGSIPPGSLPDASEIPDGDLVVDAWIEDGDLVQVAFDFIKIAEAFEAEPPPQGVESLGLRIGLEEFTGDVEAPEAAETVDFAQIFQGLLGAGFGAGGELERESGDVAPDLDDLCSQLEGAPPEVIEQFAEECPELQQ